MALSDEDKAEIKRITHEAASIIRDDKILAKLNKQYPDPPEGDPNGPKPPPKKDAPTEPPKRKDKWWGDGVPSE
jgi:hypothetical protein